MFAVSKEGSKKKKKEEGVKRPAQMDWAEFA
jgi:hypothetical protein